MFQSRYSHIFIFVLTLFVFSTCSSTIFAAWNQPPTQFTTPGLGLPPGSLASDANGNSITLAFDIPSQQLNATYFTNGAYQAPVVLYNGNVTRLTLDMNDSGIAIAAWLDQTLGSLITARFDGSSWSILPPNPLDTNVSNFAPFNPQIAVNANGDALLIWFNNPSDLRFSQFSAGTWSAPITLETPSEGTNVAYSANGTGVIGNSTGGTVNVRNYIGGVFQPTVILGLAPAGTKVEVQIDDNGNAIAVWTDNINNLLASYFNGTSWGPPQLIASNVRAFGNSRFSTAMSRNGYAIVTWIEDLVANEGPGFSSTLNGTTWSAPLLFSQGGNPGISELDVSLDTSGNALVVYSLSDPDEIRSNFLPFGGVWQAEELITVSPANNQQFVISSLSTGIAFALWETLTGEGEGDIFGSFEILAAGPPLTINGRVCRNKFESQTDRIHIITFVPSADPTIISYNLRRNGVIIAVIPANGPYIYFDHNRCRGNTDSYAVWAVGIGGLESTSLTINLR
jgi:hypothetical protein